MMQLLNPGFYSVIKIYNDPKAKETKGLGGLTGGEKKSYLAVINGGKAMKIEKGKYKYKKSSADIPVSIKISKSISTFIGSKRL